MTTTAPPRTTRKGTATIVTQPDVHGVSAIGVVAHDGRRTNLVDFHTGQPLMTPGRKLGVDVPDVAAPGNIDNPSVIAKLVWQVQRTGAKAVVVSAGATRAVVQDNEPQNGRHAAKMAYEIEATKVSLMDLPGFDEFAEAWQADQKTKSTDPLEDLRTKLEAEVCAVTGAAVLIVEPDAERRSNPYFTNQGIDPSAKSILQARAATSPVAVRGDKTPVGRIDDPSDTAAQKWGHLDEQGRFVNALTGEIEKPPAPKPAPPPPLPSVAAFPPTPPPAPPWKLGKVTEVTADVLYQFGFQTGRPEVTASRYAHLDRQGNTFLFTHGRYQMRWENGRAANAITSVDATTWVLGEIHGLVDQPVPSVDVLVVSTDDPRIDPDVLAQLIPVAILAEAKS